MFVDTTGDLTAGSEVANAEIEVRFSNSLSIECTRIQSHDLILPRWLERQNGHSSGKTLMYRVQTPNDFRRVY